MSTRRVLAKTGWVDRADPDYHKRRGPNGRLFCRWCDKEVGKGRRTFCSEECIHEWKLRSDPGYVRREVFKRDGGLCSQCRLDTQKIVQRAERLQYSLTYNRHEQSYEATKVELAEIIGQYPWAFPKSFQYGGNVKAMWHADHVKPVVEGGGECGLDNYRTLCVPCHKQETKALAARRAAQRRKEKQDGEVHLPVPDPQRVPGDA
jgi:5-methylcytosine-specific restriction endonuclease McrA